MKEILIVEDERHIADGLRFNLEAEGYLVDLVADGSTALDILGGKTFDLIVLDVMLPGVNGFEIAAKLREHLDYTPILMLTARGRPEDVLQGFAAGADDYLPKPFDLEIFLARVNGLIRRRDWSRAAERPMKSKKVLHVNGRTVDLDNLELLKDSERIPLTLMEVKLLEYLIENDGRAVSRKEILENVWQLQEDTDTRAIDNFIVRLRRYLETEPNTPRILQTVRGVGYRYVASE